MKIAPKHFIGTYKEGVHDCWTLIQDLYKEYHDISLPSYPYSIKGNSPEFVGHVLSSVELEEVQKAFQGCIIAYKVGKSQYHAGYAINETEFIHRTEDGTKVTKIPDKATIYRFIR